MRVAFTEGSVLDLSAIGDFIASENRRRARSFVAELRQACRSLSKGPERYPLQAQWPQVRRMPIGNYLVLYRVQNDTVQILRILHSAMDISRLTISD